MTALFWLVDAMKVMLAAGLAYALSFGNYTTF